MQQGSNYNGTYCVAAANNKEDGNFNCLIASIIPIPAEICWDILFSFGYKDAKFEETVDDVVDEGIVLLLSTADPITVL